MKHNNLCSIKSYNTLKEFLNKELLFSSNSIKKLLPKKIIQREVRAKDELDIDRNFLNQKLINPTYVGELIEVIDECDNFIILNKPEGIHGHPLKYSENDTVLNYLRACHTRVELGMESEDKERGLLYRLDAPTSGVLIYVKDKKLHHELRENFSSEVKSKKYLAIVCGKLEIDRDVVDSLKGSGEKGSKVICSDDGIRCESKIKTLRYNEGSDTTLVQVDLKTGFRHQIRVQLSNLGFPILGDSLYGGRESKRIYLHAFEYTLGQMSWRAEKNDLFCSFLQLEDLSSLYGL